ncbi:MAG: flagellin [Roseomonas sp.]|nr:flagellin [Roseomonas sp.]MCA3327856.1 flagellin [Roseomonas sp.]MCA3331272.1 flagellin [Roseomonas sp.]MCA3335976.1 flagellin [Roseomonas sp.]MCA3347984.1 flagellin [Roseomonas sp.]
MSLTSINTNIGAMTALQSLNRTNDALAQVQKRISTGYRVADARDDGGAYAVAQTVRSNSSALTAVNEQMGGLRGLVDVSLTALEEVSKTMIEIRSVLTRLADGTVGDQARDQYNQQYDQLRTQVTNFLADADYFGKNLLTGSTPTDDIVTLRSESVETADLYTLPALGPDTKFIVAAGPFADAAAARAALDETTGDYQIVNKTINNAMNRLGSDARYIDAQITYNRDKVDAMEVGLGALIDADLARESARLQALQIRQQLGSQTLSIANQAPQFLMSLFGGR